MAKLKLYGLRVSYYTGKMEAYLRYKGIDHDFVVLDAPLMQMLGEKTGAQQMPAIELSDGRFMTDTTPMIAWLETQYPAFPVVPDNPVTGFVSHLLEDYFEEWLWRPAMHYRWSYRVSRLHLARKIVEEFDTKIPGPDFIKRAYIRWRQHVNYVKKDGVDANTWDHVESIYLNTLDRLEVVFSKRPYLLGDKPTLGDFGLFASMFRHFAQDPTASDIMRLRAPSVFAWQARLWNAQGEQNAQIVDEIPEDLHPILDDIGEAYLPYLNANALAWQARKERFDPVIQGVQYRNVPVSQYRVWCLEELQRKAIAMSAEDEEALQKLLTAHSCWGSLFEINKPDSRYNEAHNLPFSGRRVHYDNLARN
ncbi:glutathione S-transferase N-terminal domain-containing protein [Congregibacter brevis]|uniref:Glutathione S-transferase N-terminal domain-containing protein n=1 Tax=Congregibacter brevis TaxID=3081201 RepID=A0ABZ0IFJ1_9GAMM|nr:glutathione S-transferase N-terminal domain-containing protein [Congregibacter sp. IMCC45268]